MSKGPVFVDTSAFVALINRNDASHGEVTNAFERLAVEGAPLVTHSYVLVETGALVRRRFGSAAFKRAAEVIERAAEVVWVDVRLHREAWAKASSGGRNSPGLVDWVSFLVMEEAGIVRAVSLDHHFRERGFEVLP